ncbi:MAG: 30S ribosome-binding factor RbfA [Candidatus Omnitrophica bacterium]|nr:30S ribosome-binding factor RbfA [Candidatus Omnitrophota bacterium]
MQHRSDRLASLLLKEVSVTIREDLSNPRIGFVTLTRAEVAKDLKSARIFYSVMGSDEDKKRTEIAIRNAAKEIKYLVNNRISMRYAVHLTFFREEGAEHAFRIQKILDQIHSEKPAESGEDTPAGEAT